MSSVYVAGAPYISYRALRRASAHRELDVRATSSLRVLARVTSSQGIHNNP